MKNKTLIITLILLIASTYQANAQIYGLEINQTTTSDLNQSPYLTTLYSTPLNTVIDPNATIAFSILKPDYTSDTYGHTLILALFSNDILVEILIKKGYPTTTLRYIKDRFPAGRKYGEPSIVYADADIYIEILSNESDEFFSPFANIKAPKYVDGIITDTFALLSFELSSLFTYTTTLPDSEPVAYIHFKSRAYIDYEEKRKKIITKAREELSNFSQQQIFQTLDSMNIITPPLN